MLSAQRFLILVADSALGTCSLIKGKVCVLLEKKKTGKLIYFPGNRLCPVN
jgi:hypothetical protein